MINNHKEYVDDYFRYFSSSKQKELKDYPENVEVVAREKPRNFLKHLNEAPGISLIAEVKGHHLLKVILIQR